MFIYFFVTRSEGVKMQYGGNGCREVKLNNFSAHAQLLVESEAMTLFAPVLL